MKIQNHKYIYSKLQYEEKMKQKEKLDEDERKINDLIQV